jgi:predicted transport protein
MVDKNYITLLVSLFFLIGCNLSKTSISNETTISKSCEIEEKLNDTLIIDGVYSTCMEYSSFQTIKNDECYSDYKMELNISKSHIKESVIKKVYKMNGCNASRRMVLKGIIKNDKTNYGHLGTNNAEIIVLEIIKLDEIKYDKIKNRHNKS